MDKIARLRQEIERRIALYSGWSNETVHPTRIDEDKQLLSFLDTLSEEPVNEDLEKEIQKYMDEHVYEEGEDEPLINSVARHFYELGKNSR